MLLAFFYKEGIGLPISEVATKIKSPIPVTPKKLMIFPQL